MLELIRGISPDDMKLLGAMIGTALGATWLAVKGSKRTPVEAGSQPRTDLIPYLQADVRALGRKMELLSERVDDMHAENGRNIEALRRDVALVHTDTQVIRDRQR